MLSPFNSSILQFWFISSRARKTDCMVCCFGFRGGVGPYAPVGRYIYLQPLCKAFTVVILIKLWLF